MPDRILILERDAEDPAVWRYGLAGEDGQLAADAHQLRHDPATGSEPIGESAEMLWPTVIILVRQARGAEPDRVRLDHEGGRRP